MKRFWLILLSLGLIVAFSTSAMAVDVKFSGEYYAAGMYLDKTTLRKDSSNYEYDVYTKTPVAGYTGLAISPIGAYTPGDTAIVFPVNPLLGPLSGQTFSDIYVKSQKPYRDGPSTAFYFQRLRLNTTFIVSPGLMLTTRADVMERAWGANRTAPGTALDTMSAGTVAENENIAFDLAYVTYVSPIGAFIAGYQIDGAWGTVFGDTSETYGKIVYAISAKGFTFALQMGKNNAGENSWTSKNQNYNTDLDSNFYTAALKYAWKGGVVGLLGKHIEDRSGRTGGAVTYYPETSAPLSAVPGWAAETETLYLGVIPAEYLANTKQTTVIAPFVQATFGPVAVQAELYYVFGEAKADGAAASTFLSSSKWGGKDSLDIQGIAAWVDAVADLGMFYVGGTAAYVSGDDPATLDKNEGAKDAGRDWNPCLIMFNNDLTYWAGSQEGWGSTKNSGPMTNAWFGQLRGGVRPVDKLDIGVSVAYAKADKIGNNTDREYGWEVDLTGTYKITNNLSYMLGAGYWFVGDWYKGTGKQGDINDELMVINKLTLTF